MKYKTTKVHYFHIPATGTDESASKLYEVQFITISEFINPVVQNNIFSPPNDISE